MASAGLASPAFLKTILELEGYALVLDDPDYWVLARTSERLPPIICTPIILPRKQGVILQQALKTVLRQAGISDSHYAQLPEIASAARAFDKTTCSMN